MMIESDTIKLLRECDAGVKMGIKSISDVIDKVKNEKLRVMLSDSKEEHKRIDKDIEELLEEYKDEGKEPNFIAEKMAKIKTEIKMQFEESDSTVADLMTDGCNMGVKSLSKYLNQYKAASEKAKDITKKLIETEDRLALKIREFL